MKTIWKFTLQPTDTQIIRAPWGIEWLSVQVQREELCAWAIVDTELHEEEYTVAVLGTGHDAERILGKEWAFLGTAQMAGGALVWHVFVKATP